MLLAQFVTFFGRKNVISIGLFIVNNNFEKQQESEFNFSYNHSLLNEVLLDMMLKEDPLGCYRIIKTMLSIMCIFSVTTG